MPQIVWDEGTGYDLFISLYVLHQPATFGLRASWAAGVRSRLPAAHRDTLEKVQSFLPVPLSWLYLLPAEAKTAAGALTALAQLPAAERLPTLLLTADTSTEAITILERAALRQTWSSAEQEVLRASLHLGGHLNQPVAFNHLYQAWSNGPAWGEMYLLALNTYYQVFFEEEEKRILPKLRAARAEAEDMARELPFEQLLEELSNGIHFEVAHCVQQIVLAPSYWANPLIFYHQSRPETLQMVFGRRSAAQSLVPGDTAPSDLIEAMKAIADPTRLRILRYLSDGPHTPSDLARWLRLRPPTVTHHLNTLRLAGLVEIRIHADGERVYTVHNGGLTRALTHLNEYIHPSKR